ncbi:MULTISPECIES: hypothetical protein [unclassified Saccharopolyspora]|uniref:hypothetical protein n=1 Tax=unclassified Saccharopolyspora TaxID=2646250 RepID=UPI001CD815AA|nr:MULTISPECIES: hypothetical protein [unclassified Saccharopolyspora]MCA1186901.1 hypothetical protein [Saccharopolyspora sp. 6T]MCA1193336.1 hypothetical protein [Saccharopolyspora sp. 6V]MCA1228045.1 hypothetical protein [Saccharopolyspora sp. 6M]MCA1281385.1 hypothetical protein [Saccharopolyspora sp. 7B]
MGKTHEDKAEFPPAPEGEGPLLEWYQAEDADHLVGGVVLGMFIAIFLCLLDSGFSWMSTWWLWLFVIWPPIVFHFLGRRSGYSAGADWLATDQKHYVKLYELKKITVEYQAGGQSIGIELTDADDRCVGAPLRQLQRNRAFWDLVYNGIVHSVNSGTATANELALDKLQLR